MKKFFKIFFKKILNSFDFMLGTRHAWNTFEGVMQKVEDEKNVNK
jgi:hypothetical protein